MRFRDSPVFLQAPRSDERKRASCRCCGSKGEKPHVNTPPHLRCPPSLSHRKQTTLVARFCWDTHTTIRTNSMGSTTFQLVAVAFAAALASTTAAFEAFVPGLGASGMMIPMAQQQHATCRGSSSSSRQRRTALGMKYVPDGLTPEQWKKMQKEEADKKKKMGDLGQVCVGVRVHNRFSRSVYLHSVAMCAVGTAAEDRAYDKGGE